MAAAVVCVSKRKFKNLANSIQELPAGSSIGAPHAAVAAVAATAAAAAAAVGAGDIGGAQLHAGLLPKDVELRNQAPARGLHHLALKVAEVAASHSHLQGGQGRAGRVGRQGGWWGKGRQVGVGGRQCLGMQ